MKKNIRKLILIICIGGLLYSLIGVIGILLDYHKIEEENKDLINEYVTVVEPDNSSDKDEVEEIEVFDPLSKQVDFKKLLKRNKDVVGWLYIPGTKIDEVLLLGDTNDTYIRSNIDKKYSSGGSLFLDCDNSGDFTDNNTIIYGHNMKNGSKFHNLRHYINRGQKYLDEHDVAYIYLPDGSINVYQLFATDTIIDTSSLYNKNQKYSKFVKQILSGATAKIIVSEEEAPIIMLSTCHSSIENKRYVVFGKLTDNIKKES